ncbi:MAG: NADP-dependent oxidoreductase [Sphingomonadales bacterium]|nr:NADP-dependent oxidoreductase [Sphingomonadales bacterium]
MQQVVLASPAKGSPLPENFRVETVPVPVPGDGQVLTRTLWLSLDPLLRFAIDEVRLTGATHIRPGEVMYGGTVSEIVASNHPDYAVGDIVEGRTGWREYAALDPIKADIVRGPLRKVDPALGPVETALGVLGMPGQTAHACAVGIGQVGPDDTVAISAAGGAVGTVAGQIAKIRGARVIGIAGGPAKCAAVKALGFDECVDYKATDFAERLAAAAPKGIDVYIDNTGGAVTLAVLPLLNRGARMPMCGFIAYYGVGMEGPGPDHLPGFYRMIMTKGLKIEGFSGQAVAGGDAVAEMAGWLREGRLRNQETVIEGLATAPAAFCETFRQGNSHIGKVLVHVA